MPFGGARKALYCGISRSSLPRSIRALPGVIFVQTSSVPRTCEWGAAIVIGMSITSRTRPVMPSACVNTHLDMLFQWAFSSQYGSSVTSRTRMSLRATAFAGHSTITISSESVDVLTNRRCTSGGISIVMPLCRSHEFFPSSSRPSPLTT